MAGGSGPNWLNIGFTAVMEVGFVAMAALAGPRLAKKVAPTVENLHVRDPLLVAMGLCLGLAWFSAVMDIAASVGFLGWYGLSGIARNNPICSTNPKP